MSTQLINALATYFETYNELKAAGMSNRIARRLAYRAYLALMP